MHEKVLIALSVFCALFFPHSAEAASVGDTEQCVASWYGPGLYGNRMKNGERFDPAEAAHVAHAWLPMGTIVQVKNLENQRVLIAKVTDRGPMIGGRCVDLTIKGAQRLDPRIRTNGIIRRVEITILRLP